MTADISNNDLAAFSCKNSSLLSNINRETALAYESDLDVGNRVTGHCISLVRNSLEVFQWDLTQKNAFGIRIVLKILMGIPFVVSFITLQRNVKRCVLNEPEMFWMQQQKIASWLLKITYLIRKEFCSKTPRWISWELIEFYSGEKNWGIHEKNNSCQIFDFYTIMYPIRQRRNLQHNGIDIMINWLIIDRW